MLCQAPKLEILSQQASQCPSLKVVIKMGSEVVSEEEREMVEKSDLKVYSMREVEVSYLNY